MLVEAMNHAEIAAQVYSEYIRIMMTTAVRLQNEYDRERRKLRIDKSAIYPRHYTIKTKGKNNWLIFIGKAPSQAKYKGQDCANVCCVVYYYTAKGLRVFVAAEEMFIVFNGHLFKRYNERLNLNLTSTLEAVIHFFKFNGYVHPHAMEKNGKMFTVGLCKDGFLLGQLKHNNAWLEWKTFVSRDLARAGQVRMKEEVLQQLHNYIETESKKETYDATIMSIIQDKIRAIA